MHVIFFALVAAAAAATPTPTLRASRSKRVWVRRPDGGTQIELVPSLAKLCEAEGLDLECMTAVSKGEATEHRGWTCGTVCAPAAEVTTAGAAAGVAVKPKAKSVSAGNIKPKAGAGKTAAAAKAATTAAADAAAAAEAVAPSPPPSAMGFLGSKMVVQFAVSTLASKAVKRMDSTAEGFVQKLRLAFYVIVGARLLLEFVIRWRIAAAGDDTPLETPGAVADPMAAIMASMLGMVLHTRVCIHAHLHACILTQIYT